VRAPRWIVGGLSVGQDDETVHVEANVPGPVVEALGAVGMPYAALPVHSESTGHAQLITRDPHGTLAVASDERADGAGSLVPRRTSSPLQAAPGHRIDPTVVERQLDD
jgi:hypothetical protein